MAPKPEVKPPTKYDLILGVRRLKTGSFSGLYEVVELTENGSVKRVLTDANTKQLAMTVTSNAIYDI